MEDHRTADIFAEKGILRLARRGELAQNDTAWKDWFEEKRNGRQERRPLLFRTQTYLGVVVVPAGLGAMVPAGLVVVEPGRGTAPAAAPAALGCAGTPD